MDEKQREDMQEQYDYALTAARIRAARLAAVLAVLPTEIDDDTAALLAVQTVALDLRPLTDRLIDATGQISPHFGWNAAVEALAGPFN